MCGGVGEGENGGEGGDRGECGGVKMDLEVWRCRWEDDEIIVLTIY